MAAKGTGYKGKGKGKGKGLYYAGTIEEDDMEDMDRQEKEESEQQSEQKPDDAWWLGSMNALTREPKTSWTQPMPQKGATNRLAVLAEPDTHGTASAASHSTSEAQEKTMGRSTKLGKRKKVSWSQAPEWCWYTRVPRVQYLMMEEETKSVCAIAKDIPRAGFRLVEAVVDSVAEGSVVPPNVFPGEIRASAMSKTGGKYEAATGTRMPNLGQRVTFKAQGGEMEHIKTGRKMMLVKKGGFTSYECGQQRTLQVFQGQGSE